MYCSYFSPDGITFCILPLSQLPLPSIKRRWYCKVLDLELELVARAMSWKLKVTSGICLELHTNESDYTSLLDEAPLLKL
jgi:hypothetical protein